MPSSLTNTNSHRQSWPPTQLRLVRARKSIEPRPLLEDIDEDPLTYFLTPNPDDNDNEDDDEDMPFSDFDAGIEVAGRPRRDDLVRSVSPSTLDGLGKIRRAAASPDFDSDGLTSDDGDDDDGEEYIRLSPSPPPARQSLAVPPRHSFTVGSYPFGFRSRSPIAAAPGRTTSPPFLVSSSFPPPSAGGVRGRPTTTARRGRWSVPSPRAARPGHLWREPSADVWSIEEETEEELTMSETRGRFMPAKAERAAGAKPVKRVRFVLPSEQ